MKSTSAVLLAGLLTGVPGRLSAQEPAVTPLHDALDQVAKLTHAADGPEGLGPPAEPRPILRGTPDPGPPSGSVFPRGVASTLLTLHHAASTSGVPRKHTWLNRSSTFKNGTVNVGCNRWQGSGLSHVRWFRLVVPLSLSGSRS